MIPVLKEINPSLLSSFKKTLENLQESQQILEDRIEEVSSEIIETKEAITKINIVKIQQLSNPKAYLYQLLKNHSFTEWNDVYDLLSAQSGKQVFSKTHRLLKDRDFLMLTKKEVSSFIKDSFEITENQSKITQPIQLTFEEIQEKSTENKQTIYVDKDLLKYPLLVRKWQNGEYLYPTKMQGKKKLSKFFKDDKFSLLEKENTWLLCNADNEIIWVVNHRQDRRFSTTSSTRKTLKITTL